MNAAKKIAPETVTRYVGNCQICERDQKLTVDMRMVHHGYKRPGDGSIEGDCPGVDAVPYETSCDAIKAYVKGLKGQLKVVHDQLTEIASGKVVYFDTTEVNWRTMRVVAKSFSKYVSAHFDADLDEKRRKLEHEEYSLMHDIEHRTARIKVWVKKPTRTIEEMAAKEQADKDSRKAEREAARATRNAKKAATTAKQEALQKKRQEAFNVFDAKIIATAALSGSERDAAKMALRYERQLKKNEWMWNFHHSAEAGQALLALGMGHYGHNKVVYGDWH